MSDREDAKTLPEAYRLMELLERISSGGGRVRVVVIAGTDGLRHDLLEALMSEMRRSGMPLLNALDAIDFPYLAEPHIQKLRSQLPKFRGADIHAPHRGCIRAQCGPRYGIPPVRRGRRKS